MTKNGIPKPDVPIMRSSMQQAAANEKGQPAIPAPPAEPVIERAVDATAASRRPTTTPRAKPRPQQRASSTPSPGPICTRESLTSRSSFAVRSRSCASAWKATTTRANRFPTRPSRWPNSPYGQLVPLWPVGCSCVGGGGPDTPQLPGSRCDPGWPAHRLSVGGLGGHRAHHERAGRSIKRRGRG